MDFCLSPKIWAVNIGKNLIGKYGENLSDRTEKSAADTLKTSSKRATQKSSRSNWWFDWQKLKLLLIKFQKSEGLHHRNSYKWNWKCWTE